jgi:hypothetical protein
MGSTPATDSRVGAGVEVDADELHRVEDVLGENETSGTSLIDTQPTKVSEDDESNRWAGNTETGK